MAKWEALERSGVGAMEQITADLVRGTGTRKRMRNRAGSTGEWGEDRGGVAEAEKEREVG